jgi:hypothetical protein
LTHLESNLFENLQDSRSQEVLPMSAESNRVKVPSLHEYSDSVTGGLIRDVVSGLTSVVVMIGNPTESSAISIAFPLRG